MDKTTSTVIAIADNCVRSVSAKFSRGQANISHALVQRTGSDSDADVLNALLALAKEKQIKSNGAFLVLPRHLAIVKVLRLPSQEERELRQMVEIQISSQTPYTLEEVEFEYRKLSSDSEGYTQVVLIVIPKEVSNRYIRLMNEANIPLSGLTISSIGLLGWFNYQVSQNRLSAHQPVALCAIDVNHAEICFFHGDRLLFSRSINSGLQEVRSSPQDMIRQVELSLKHYRNEKMGADLSRFVIAADQLDLQDFVAELEHKIQIPCELISTTEGLSLPKNIDRSLATDDSGPTLSAAAGIQFLDRKQVINLLPNTIRVSKQSKALKLELVKIGILALIAGGLFLFRMSIDVRLQEDKATQLRKAITSLDPEIDEAKRKMRLIEYFDGYAKTRVFIPEIMSRLAKLIPEDISLRALYLNEKGVFTVQGYAQTREALNDFQAKLVNEPLFRKVNLEFATSRKIFNMQVTDFKFTSLITQEDE